MIVTDTSQHPLIVVHWSGEITIDEADAFFESLDASLRQARAAGTPLAVIHLADVDKVAPVVRSHLAEHGRRFIGDDLKNIVVLRSTIARGILTAIRWVTPVALQTRVVASLEQAMNEARDHLDIGAVHPDVTTQPASGLPHLTR